LENSQPTHIKKKEKVHSGENKVQAKQLFYKKINTDHLRPIIQYNGRVTPKAFQRASGLPLPS
jgi:ribosomal protein S30